MAVRSSKRSDSYQKTTLPNGLRVVTETISSVRSVTLGVWVDVGSRNETPEIAGVTHLIEHMLFKGTKNRSARQIAESLESIGGNLNAFTSREQTCFTARVLDESLETAVDVLSDLTCNATLTPTNLKKEKMVVAEEIKESIDNPTDQIHDLFASSYWKGHPLGRPILGEMDTVIPMARKAITKYISEHYKADSIVFSAAGSLSHNRLVQLAKKYFDFPTGKVSAPLAAHRENVKRITVQTNDNHQTHALLGFPSISYSDQDRFVSAALSSYLGGGMSSVLFQKIREEKGLVYTVYSYNDYYRDTGILGTYLATDEKNLPTALEITLKEINKLKKRKISSERMDQLKAQIKGQITLALESTSSRMSRLGRQELMLGEFQSISTILKHVDRVTPQKVLELANRIFVDDQLTVAVLGPTDEKALDGI